MNRQIEEAKECLKISEWKIVQSKDNRNNLTFTTKSILLPYLILYLTDNNLLNLDNFIGKGITSATIYAMQTQIQIALTKLIANEDLNYILEILYEQQNPIN